MPRLRKSLHGRESRQGREGLPLPLPDRRGQNLGLQERAALLRLGPVLLRQVRIDQSPAAYNAAVDT